MKEYIDKTALKMMIRHHIKEEPYHYFCKCLLSEIDTLGVTSVATQDVDIEKEVMDWRNNHYSRKDYTFEKYNGHYLENSTVIEIAKYFFELGLKTKEE